MSIPLMAMVWTSTMTDATKVEVLSRLASHANEDGESCFAGVPRIAKLVRRSERTVQRTIESLEKDGWLTVVRGCGAGDLTQYLINVEKLKGCQDVTLLSSQKRVTSAQKRVTLAQKKGDIGDNPPHPLLGRNLKANKSKPLSAPAAPPEKAERDELLAPEIDPEKLTSEQQEHLDRLAKENKSGVEVESWRLHYLGENLEAAEECARAAAEAARDGELRAEYPDLETALERVRKHCGFVWACNQSQPLAQVLRQALIDRADAGEAVWRAAPRMVEAWLARRGAWRYGPAAFFSNGEWAKGGER